MARKERTADELALLFRDIVGQTIVALSSLVKDLRDQKLTDKSTKDVDTVAKFVGCYDQNKLINAFLDGHEVWGDILDKNLNFFRGDFETLFKDVPIDTKVLIEPVVLYLKYKSGEIVVKKSFPVEEEDIQGLWKYLHQLIKGACLYADKINYKHDLTKYKNKVGL